MNNTNSILFDFYSLIDIELSLLKFIKSEYKDIDLPNLDKNKILYTDEKELIHLRQFGEEDLFKSLLIGDEYKKNYYEILTSLINENENEILEKDYVQLTAMSILLSAYRRAGNGIVHTTVQCETEEQKEYILKKFPYINNIEFNKREDIDMNKYSRLIVGDYRNALKYRLNKPKSILILNYRDNFNYKDSTQLKVELIIKFGDIHDIAVISAYRDDEEI